METARVLVVDDDEDIRVLVAARLEAAGYRADMVADGPEALRAIRDDKPDLVILDVMMPGMSGFDVCREIREDPAVADLPVIMLTARDDGVAKLLGRARGADRYLAKPFDAPDLLSAVEELTARGN
ncbi:response regulator transcription factor [Virgisporangium aliadipatigenens]|nr:response regulator [Virgisporangium aliadipatigenens]